MKISKFHPSKQVMIFNGAYVLVAIARSLHSASEISGSNAQAISFACNGKYISAGNLYYRYVHADIKIDVSELGTLKLQDYDKMCNDERRYHSIREMARRRRITENRRKANKNKANE